MSDEQEQPPTALPPEKYGDSQQRKPVSASLQRASYNNDDMIWPAPADGYSDAQPTLPRRGRGIVIQVNAMTLVMLGSIVLLLVIALLGTLLIRAAPHTATQSNPPERGSGTIASGTVPTTAILTTPTASVVATNAPVTVNTPGGKPVVVPTQVHVPPGATALPTATPTPPTCDEIYPSGSPVTLFGDDGVSGDSGSGTPIGSMSSYFEVKRAISGNACSITSVQQIVNVNLNNAPETDGSRCTNSPYPCVAQGTLVQSNESTQQILSTTTNGYPFGGQVSRNIFGGTATAPLNGNQCASGTTEYIDNFSRTHQGGSVRYCWSS